MRWIASKKATWQQCSMNWKPKASPIPHLYNHCHAARYHTQELGNLQQGDVPFPWGRYFQDLKATFAAETPANLSQILPFKCSRIFYQSRQFLVGPMNAFSLGTFKAKKAYITMWTNVFKMTPCTDRRPVMLAKRPCDVRPMNWRLIRYSSHDHTITCSKAHMLALQLNMTKCEHGPLQSTRELCSVATGTRAWW